MCGPVSRTWAKGVGEQHCCAYCATPRCPMQAAAPSAAHLAASCTKPSPCWWLDLTAARLLQAPAPDNPDKLKAMLKERFKKFNEGLEAVYVQQSAWTIPDAQLRGAVKRVIKQDLLPPYQQFLSRWGAAGQWGGC